MLFISKKSWGKKNSVFKDVDQYFKSRKSFLLFILTRTWNLILAKKIFDENKLVRVTQYKHRKKVPTYLLLFSLLIYLYSVTQIFHSRFFNNTKDIMNDAYMLYILTENLSWRIPLKATGLILVIRRIYML